MSEVLLTADQIRVLGSMIEKQITTPANYPMTPNAVRVACNQKSNRDPVVEFSDDTVFDTLKSLERLGYVASGLLDNTQTIKYKQKLNQALALERGELVILCELFNRGPQTPGELRSRCERMFKFQDLADVELCLSLLVTKRLAVMLERLPGTKEHRWAHLFCGKPDIAVPVRIQSNPATQNLEARVASLESQLSLLEARMVALEGQKD
jgi:hypothetical protein